MATKIARSGNVRAIRAGVRIPSQREEDQKHIMLARVTGEFERRAYELAQADPNSDEHLFALHMASAKRKLPCNNLRIFATPEDTLQGIFKLWRQTRIADLEWQLCEERRMEATMLGDELAKAHWTDREDEADRRRWHIYERLLRVPAASESDVTTYKLSREFTRGMGNLKWMRTYKPELAAILDDELARFAAQKQARKAARLAKATKEA